MEEKLVVVVIPSCRTPAPLGVDRSCRKQRCGHIECHRPFLHLLVILCAIVATCVASPMRRLLLLDVIESGRFNAGAPGLPRAHV